MIDLNHVIVWPEEASLQGNISTEQGGMAVRSRQVEIYEKEHSKQRNKGALSMEGGRCGV